VTLFLAFAVFVSVVLSLPGWRVNWPLFIVYWATSGAVWLAERRSDWLARLAGLAIPLVDMPAVTALHGAALTGANAAFVFGSNGSLLVLLIIGSTATLDTREAVPATLVAIGMQTLLGLQVGGIVATIMFTDLVMVFAFVGCTYLIRRMKALVGEATAEQVRRERLGRYFSPEVAALLADAESDDAAGESRDVTVLFSDIRDFTALTEQFSGTATISLLNAYHERMVQTLFANGGTLDKYLGDGMMMYFGAPVAQPDHAERAVRCALAMQHELARWNAERGQGGAVALRMGIGVHTGRVVLGDVGAMRRREYTVIGHAVNVAARLQDLTKTVGGSILVSDDTRRAVGDRLSFEPAGRVQIRGHTGTLMVYVPIPGG